MKRVNIKERTQKLNEFVSKNSKCVFSAKELQDALNALGFTRTIASAIMNKIFPFKKKGNTRTYSCPKDPIYMGLIEQFYKSSRNKRNAEKEKSVSDMQQQKAWNTLVEAGIIKTKFNIHLLKTKYPEIYLECLEYEIVK